MDIGYKKYIAEKLFYENFDYLIIEVLNCFASGKEPYMNARNVARSIIEKTEYNNMINELFIFLEQYILNKANKVSVFLKNKDNDFFQKNTFIKYFDFENKYEKELSLIPDL